MTYPHDDGSVRSLGRRAFVRTGLSAVAAAPFLGCSPTDRAEEVPQRDSVAAPNGVGDEAWADVRTQFVLDRGTAYMNNASLGMPPEVVADAVADGYLAISREPLHGKHELQEAIADRVIPGLARFFGAAPGEISLTRNATEALHLQTIGLDLRAGDEVLITTQEHPAGRRPWLFRAARDGIRVREVFVPSPIGSADQIVEIFEREITDRTAAIAFCHVTRGGHLYPVARLCSLARDRGIASLVDGAQAVGQFPIDLAALGCDAYSASLHKWMLGPAGTGFLYVGSSARERITSAFDPEAGSGHPALEPPGTADFPVRAATATALDFIETIGVERVEARCRYLSDYLKDRLAELPDVTLLSGSIDTSCPGSTIFEKRGLSGLAAVPLIEASISTHIDEHQRDGHDAIRVSTHIYNTTAEIDRLVGELGEARG